MKIRKLFVTRFTASLNQFSAKSHTLPDKLAASLPCTPGSDFMRLQLISGAVILYTIAVLVWLCYVGIGATP